MTSIDILFLGTVGLSLGFYILGRFHGARKVRRSTARFIRHLAPYKEMN
jgi:hypothetical protein